MERTAGSSARKTFASKRDLRVFGLFLLLAVIFLLPGSLHPRTALLGVPGDTFQHTWFLWHFARAVIHGRNPLYTDLIFYPDRVNLAWSTTDPLASLMALPVSLVAGPIAAYNLSLILQLALAGFFGYLLCLRICRNFAAAIIGGVCFGFSPWLMGEALGHLSLATAFPIPLYFLALDTLLRRGTGNVKTQWRDGISLGLALFLTALAHYNYTVFCALLTLVVICVDLALEGSAALARQIWKPLAIAAATFALLFAPFFVMLWANPTARPRSRSFDLIEGHSADALGWFVPGWSHLLFGRFAQHWNLGLFSAGYEGTVYLGPIIIVLAAIGLWAGRRTNKLWTIRLLVTALVFWILSLGPHIRVAGKQTRVSGPGYLFYESPFARFVSAPARFHVIAMLCFAALAAMGIARILSALSSSRTRATAIAVICVLLALDLLTVPFPVVTSAASAQNPGFAIRTDGCSLPADVTSTTVVTVPELEWPYPVRAMWMQINDGGRYALADGYVSYGPDSTWQKFWSVPLLRSLREIQQPNGVPINPGEIRATIPAAILEMNLGAIVVFDFPQRDATVAYLKQILDQPSQREQHCTIFDLRTATPPNPAVSMY